MDNYAALRDAVLGASQLQAPGGNPLGASNAPELSKLYESSFQLPQSNAATQAQAANTAVTVDNSKQALKAQAQQLQDMANPDKYQKLRKADGGFDFVDPAGNKIDIHTFAQRTGQRRADIVADSDNPIDQQYISDYKNLQDLLNAAYNEDVDTLDAWEEQVPGVSKMKPQDLIDRFQNYYSRYYTPNYQGTGEVGNPAFPNLGG